MLVNSNGEKWSRRKENECDGYYHPETLRILILTGEGEEYRGSLDHRKLSALEFIGLGDFRIESSEG